MPVEILSPFYVGSDGAVVTTSDPDVQVRQHVSSLINTEQTERVMLPDYGTPLSNLIFEDADSEDVAAQAAQMVRDAFALWEPGVDLLRAEPVTDPNGDDFARVDVLYQRRDSPDTSSSAGRNTAIISADGVVREVVRG